MAKILVVDDQVSVARSTQMVLESMGHQVAVAHSAEEAEALAVEQQPDLLIVDVMMPEGTEGFHLVWKLRQTAEAAVRDVPIIMATGIHEHTELRFYPESSDGTYKAGEFLPVQGGWTSRYRWRRSAPA